MCGIINRKLVFSVNMKLKLAFRLIIVVYRSVRPTRDRKCISVFMEYQKSVQAYARLRLAIQNYRYAIQNDVRLNYLQCSLPYA